jgi:hypothetical protein
MNRQSIDYTNQDFFLGIDVHEKSWKVTVRTKGMQLKTFSMDPSPEQVEGPEAPHLKIVTSLLLLL